MRTAAIAFLTGVLIAGATTARACDSDALGTSRVLSFRTNT